ncbi:MAG TPA: hypothetical protein VL242_51325 [Sorangium sp.]|nr:hypothetical protein [Sorangium sp.]
MTDTPPPAAPRQTDRARGAFELAAVGVAVAAPAAAAVLLWSARMHRQGLARRPRQEEARDHARAPTITD